MARVAALTTRTETRVRTSAILWLCLAVFIWPVIEELPRFMSRAYSPYQIVWMRYATHILFMLAIFIPRQEVRLVRTKRLRLQLLRSLMMLGMPIFFVFGILHMPADDALSIFWLSPLIILGLAMALLRERVNWLYWIATLAGFIGTLLILQPGGGVLRRAAVWPLGMALCFSFYLVMSRYLRDEDIFTSLFYTTAGVLVPLSIALPFIWKTPTLKDGLLMAAIGLLGFVVLFALDKSLELAPASAVAPFALTQPVWVMVLHYLLTRNWPGGFTILGALIVIVSGFYLFWLNASTQ